MEKGCILTTTVIQIGSMSLFLNIVLNFHLVTFAYRMFNGVASWQILSSPGKPTVRSVFFLLVWIQGHFTA